MEEIWTGVRDYSTVYQVSNLGRVRREKRILGCSEHGKRKAKVVNLCYEGKVERRTLRRVVADAFVPKPPNVRCVKMRDPKKGYNSDNLYWSNTSK